MKFLVPNYSCLQNPLNGGYCPPPPDPCPLSSTEFVEPLRTKFLGTPLFTVHWSQRHCVCKCTIFTLLKKDYNDYIMFMIYYSLTCSSFGL